MSIVRSVHRFVVTLRWESGGIEASQSEWRGEITNVVTEEAACFRGIHGMPGAWHRLTREISDPEETSE